MKNFHCHANTIACHAMPFYINSYRCIEVLHFGSMKLRNNLFYLNLLTLECQSFINWIYVCVTLKWEKYDETRWYIINLNAVQKFEKDSTWLEIDPGSSIDSWRLISWKVSNVKQKFASVKFMLFFECKTKLKKMMT